MATQVQFNSNIYTRINSNNVNCKLCGTAVPRRRRGPHWKGDPHRGRLKALIGDEMNRANELTVDHEMDINDARVEEEQGEQEIRFDVSPGEHEKVIQLAGHSWLIQCYLDDVLDHFSIELNDQFDANHYLIMNATVKAELRLDNQVFSKECSMLLLRDLHPITLFHQLNLAEGDVAYLSLTVRIHRYELVPIAIDEEVAVEEGPKRGRPVEYVNYNNLTTKLWLALFHNNRGRPLSARLLQQIFDVVLHKGFVALDTAPTEYIAQRCDSFFLDCIPLSELAFPGTEEVVRYCDPERILEYVMKTPSLTNGWVNAYTNDETIDHPSASEGWKIIQDHFQATLDTGNALLVMAALWIDGFVGNTSRNKSYTTISITFANFPNSLACRHRSRFCIANIPPSLKNYKMDFVKRVIVPFLLKLERKELPVFDFCGQLKLPVGALHAVKGDHMSKIELAGIVAPSGISSSFYTTTPSAMFGVVNTELRKLRDPEDAREQIERINTLPPGEKTIYIQQTGYNGVVSPFWSLPLVARNFFQRFSACELHLLFLGVVKTITKYFGVDLPSEDRIELNARMRQMIPPEGYVRITMTIFKEDSKKICSMKGDMWLTFAAQSIILLKRHFSRHLDKYRLWKAIMNGVITVVTKQWRRPELVPDGELARLIASMKQAMLELYPEANWSFPNFETLFALPSQIAFLGPLHFQSTARDEEMNRRRRQILQVSNGRDQANFLTAVVEKVRAAGEVMIENNDGQSVKWEQLMSHKKEKPMIEDYDWILPDEPEPLQLRNQDLPRIRLLVQSLPGNARANVEVESAYTIKGFYWNGQKIRVDDSPENDIGLILHNEDKVTTGLLTLVFVVNVTADIANERRHYTLPLLSLRPIRMTSIERKYNVGEGAFYRDVEFFPLGWGGYSAQGIVKVVQEGANLFVWY